MALDIEKVKQRIAGLLEMTYHRLDPSTETIVEVDTALDGIIGALYGGRGQRFVTYLKAWEESAPDIRLCAVTGVLRSMQAEIDMGMAGDWQKEIEGAVFADFVSLAKAALEENKDAAAVVVAAALEDTLKRMAIAAGLDVNDKPMPEVINALKAEGVLSGAQPELARGYVKLRNKAFHAEWGQIDKPEVGSAIGFTEQLLAKHFSL